MRNKLLVVILLAMLVPSVAMAVWWNPISWFKIFQQKDPIATSQTKDDEGARGSQGSGYKNSDDIPESPENQHYYIATTSERERNNGSTGTNENANENSACPSGGQPMCATNGITYRNYCEMQRAGATYFYGSACVASSTPPAGSSDSGATTTPSPCPSAGQPMCATNGITYRNYCEMQRAGATYNYGSACVTPASSGSSTGAGTSAGSNSTSGDSNSSTPVPSDSNTGSNSVSSYACGVRAASSQSVNLVVRDGTYYFRPVPAKAGQPIVFWATIRNLGPDDMGRWRTQNIGIGSECYSTVYFRVDLNSDGTWDVLKKDDMGQLRKDHDSLKSSGNWIAVVGSHRYQICADGGAKIDETNESDNCVNGTIEVSP